MFTWDYIKQTNNAFEVSLLLICVILCDCLLGRSKHQTMSWVKSCGS